MTSAFHRPKGPPPGAVPVQRHRGAWNLHPSLTYVLNSLDGTALGKAFKDRAVDVSMLKLLGEPVNYTAALAAHRYLLERADGDGLPLTAAGYLKPVDVQAIAEVLPTMRDWRHKIGRESDSYPVLSFREHLQDAGLLRKYKGSLRLSRAGRVMLGDPNALWEIIADSLVPTDSEFGADAAVVVLVHMATTEGSIDVDLVAKTLTELGWGDTDGGPISTVMVYNVWNELWEVLGNIGENTADNPLELHMSHAARIMVHCALFQEVAPR